MLISLWLNHLILGEFRTNLKFSSWKTTNMLISAQLGYHSLMSFLFVDLALSEHLCTNVYQGYQSRANYLSDPCLLLSFKLSFSNFLSHGNRTKVLG